MWREDFAQLERDPSAASHPAKIGLCPLGRLAKLKGCESLAGRLKEDGGGLPRPKGKKNRT